MDTPRKRSEEILHIKNNVKEIENAPDGFISALDTAEERTIELEEMSMGSSKAEIQRRNKWEKVYVRIVE